MRTRPVWRRKMRLRSQKTVLSCSETPKRNRRRSNVIKATPTPRGRRPSVTESPLENKVNKLLFITLIPPLRFSKVTLSVFVTVSFGRLGVNVNVSFHGYGLTLTLACRCCEEAGRWRSFSQMLRLPTAALRAPCGLVNVSKLFMGVFIVDDMMTANTSRLHTHQRLICCRAPLLFSASCVWLSSSCCRRYLLNYFCCLLLPLQCISSCTISFIIITCTSVHSVAQRWCYLTLLLCISYYVKPYPQPGYWSGGGCCRKHRLRHNTIIKAYCIYLTS